MSVRDQQLADIYRELERLSREVTTINEFPTRPGGGTTTPGPQGPRPQAVNLIRNGTYSHSVGSWARSTTADDRRYECAWWFSHPDVDNHPMHGEWDSDTPGTKTFTDGNVTTGTGNIAITAHGYKDGDVIRLTTTGTLPSAYALATDYYVIYVDADNIKLAASLTNAYAGTAITGGITSSPAATHTVTPTNFTLKSDDHAGYSSSFSNWSRNDTPAGVAFLNQGYSLDAPLAQPTAEPSYTLYAVFNIAKLSPYLTCPDDARITAELYGRQNDEWDLLYGAFTVTAEVSGTVNTPTSRDYVVHVRTTRGFTIQTSVTTVAGAPSDADFAAGARVLLSWPRPLQYGIIGYDVYRNTAGTYKLLDRVETGFASYIDNNSFRNDTVVAYPSADFTRLVTFNATLDRVLKNTATDGLDESWDTLPFALRVPANYNHSLTDFDRWQWVRWKVTGLNSDRWDVRVTDGVTTAGVQAITSAAGQFTASMVGKTCTLTYDDGTSESFAISTYTSPTEIGTGIGNEPTQTSGKVEIVVTGGADTNKLVVDLAHLSFGEGAIYGPHPDDLSADRGTPPVAGTGSNQGGQGNTGGGTGTGDGQPTCPHEDELVTVTDGAGSIFTKPAKDLFVGEWLVIGNRIAEIGNLSHHIADIWQIETENGFTARTSATHKYLTHTGDTVGKRVEDFKVGDAILTQIDGRDVLTTVASRRRVMKRGIVVEISLKVYHQYLIGDGPYKKWGGIASENNKRIDVPVELPPQF